MKKVLLLCASLLFPVLAFAQYDTRAEVMADIARAGGEYYPYPTRQPAPTAAPKGYKAFYVSHVGRHGSRHGLGGTLYEDILSSFSRGHEKGWLTPEGEVFYQAYKDFYPSIARREGNLTRKGQEQHRYIASQLYKNYPSIFKGATHAEAVSTVSHRVIVSMFFFLSQLDNTDRDFTFEADYGQPSQSYLLPDIIDSQIERDGLAQEKYLQFRSEVLDPDGMLGKWFTRPDSLVTGSKYSFCNDLHTLVSSLDNVDVPAPRELYDVFTPEERYSLWRVKNYRHYQLLARTPDNRNLRVQALRPLLNDILEKAEADWQNGVQLRLRFAHDSTLMPLLSLMDVNGMGISLEDPYQVENHWRNFDIPMACNLQLVFFRSKKNPDILVQVLLNGVEATLPLEMAAPGSFYRWEDIRARYLQ